MYEHFLQSHSILGPQLQEFFNKILSQGSDMKGKMKTAQLYFFQGLLLTLGLKGGKTYNNFPDE